MASGLVVKRTFIEVEADRARSAARPRADTDTVVDYRSDSAWCSSSSSDAEMSDVVKGADSFSSCETPSLVESWADASEADTEACSASSRSDAGAGCEEWLPNGACGYLMNASSNGMVYMMVPMCNEQGMVDMSAWYGQQRREEPPKSRSSRRKAKRGSKTAPRTVDEIRGTVVVLRQLSKSLKRDALLELLDAQFAGRYDFAYLPVDFKTSKALGYALINFDSDEATEAALAAFHGVNFEGAEIAAERSKSHSGLESLLERYRDSPIMQDGVADDFRPVLFSDGRRVPFP